jgi:hypothetical protein
VNFVANQPAAPLSDSVSFVPRKLSALGPKRPQADAEYEHEEDHSTDDVDTVDRGHAPILARKAQSQPLAVLRFACGLGKRELTGQPGSMKLLPASL